MLKRVNDSSGGNTQQPFVRKVVSINSPNEVKPEGESRDVTNVSFKQNVNFVKNVKEFAGSAANTAGGAMKNAFYAVKNSWFGIKPIARGVSDGVGKAASFMNVSKKAMSITLAVLLLGGGSSGVISLINYQHQQMIFKQEDYWDPCVDMVDEANKLSGMTPPAVDVNEQMLANAKKIWAVGKALGMTDEQCAGMLGNMQQESGYFDPFAVECVSSEPFQIGPKKAALLPEGNEFPNEQMKSHVLDTIYHAYKSGTFSNPSMPGYCIEYGNPSSGYICGLGLIQWTGHEAKELIEYARGRAGKHWYDMDLQLANLFGSAEWQAHIQAFMNDAKAKINVRDAAAAWLGYVERTSNTPEYERYESSERQQYAQYWYTALAPQSAAITREFSGFANDVVTMAGSVVSAATDKNKKAVDEECLPQEPQADNSTLAAAAVAYAWPTIDQSRGNDGTELYKAVKDAVYPGDWIYQSCDRGVATAVVWSGADDNFPVGDTSAQDVYMSTHPELWKDLGLYDTLGEPLQPGDILVTTRQRRSEARGKHCEHGHIWMYVGNEEVQKKYPGNTCDMVHASYQSRSPGIGEMGNYGHNEGYKVYRYIGSYNGIKKSAYTGNASGDS